MRGLVRRVAILLYAPAVGPGRTPEPKETRTMMKTTTRVRNTVYALLVGGALGFGATQVTAAPSSPADEARACSERACDNQCRAQGGIDGRCNNGQCLCLF